MLGTHQDSDIPPNSKESKTFAPLASWSIILQPMSPRDTRCTWHLEHPSPATPAGATPWLVTLPGPSVRRMFGPSEAWGFGQVGLASSPLMDSIQVGQRFGGLGWEGDAGCRARAPLFLLGHLLVQGKNVAFRVSGATFKMYVGPQV